MSPADKAKAVSPVDAACDWVDTNRVPATARATLAEDNRFTDSTFVVSKAAATKAGMHIVRREL